jgi:hypothetical protein
VRRRTARDGAGRSVTTGATDSVSMKNRGGAWTTWARMGRLAGLLWQLGHEGFRPKGRREKGKTSIIDLDNTQNDF